MIYDHQLGTLLLLASPSNRRIAQILPRYPISTEHRLISAPIAHTRRWLVIAANSPLRSGADQPSLTRHALHGLAVELRSGVSSLQPEIAHLLGPSGVTDWPQGFSPVSGNIQAYDAADIQRRLSTHAVPFAASRDLLELYQENERFWLIDERWGIAELNILKGQWKSWVLPNPTTDAMRCAETAVLWPMAQLLRPKGLHLIPAVSVARAGWAALILSPFNIEPELTTLVRAGYRIIGQRWTALREEDGRIAMLNLPGWVESTSSPRPRSFNHGSTSDMSSGRIDLTVKFPGSELNHAFCDAVLITEPGRRPDASLRDLGYNTAVNLLRRSWPIVDLTPHLRRLQLAPKLAQQCRVGQLQLSRNPGNLLHLLDGFRKPKPRAAMNTNSPVELTLHLNSKSPRSLAV
jgi:hypothetical protein